VAAARALRAAMGSSRLAGIRDLHPGYCTLLITLDPGHADPERIEAEIRRIATALDCAADEEPARVVEIPVCYDPECAPDLPDVAQRAGIDAAEAARRHAAAEYRVGFLGFTPGFPYLLGLPEELATPRLSAPRRRVPAGSVAIAGAQAGIYPFATPGGWRLIGRTPVRLFDVARARPALLAPGDGVRFVAISTRELHARTAS
jgi:KipI family sensor histidine kinase inhibitor